MFDILQGDMTRSKVILTFTCLKMYIARSGDTSGSRTTLFIDLLLFFSFFFFSSFLYFFYTFLFLYFTQRARVNELKSISSKLLI